MIEGITVLNQTEITDMPKWFGFAFGTCILLTILFVIGITIFDNTVSGLLALIAGISCLMSVAIGVINEQPTGRYKYECIIDESVDFVDIYEKYNVVEQRGEIWVLEDKESED